VKILWIKVDKELEEKFPGLRAYVLEIRGIDVNRNDPKTVNNFNTLLKEVTEYVKSRYTLDGIKNEQIFRAYRDFFWKIGIDPTKTRPASEALIRRILLEKPIPRINTLVDAYNLASIVSGVPIAAFDKDKISGELFMRKAFEGEKFLGIGMEKPIILNGTEIVVSDDEKLVAVYPYRDAEVTKISERTRNVVFLICGVPGVGDDMLDNALNKLTLSTAEVGRFLHTVPSMLWGTCVLAFTPSWFWDCLQWVCHHPVNAASTEAAYILLSSYEDSTPSLEPPTQFGPEPYSSLRTSGPHPRATCST
jgi:DNA/RNA-binding domain of Phe-tRNA-synthetase-like protein